MLEFEYIQNLDEKLYKMIDIEFNKYAIKNDLKCNYKSFAFVVKDKKKVIGIITGNSYYKEIHIGELIILEEYRGKNIGKQLMQKVEEYYKDKGFENMNLTTYAFQAPEFYKKCGFEIEYIRRNKENSKLDKYFMVKYF